jgi:hypothetical protein
VSLNPSNVVLRSSVLGKVTLPRSEVANIIFATAGRSNAVLSRAGSTNGLPRSSVQTGVKSKSELADLLRQLNGDTNSTSEVQQQILGGAGPEATQKYRQMLRDLSSGKMTLNDLRAQAKAAADQARSQRGDANGELGAMLDSYLSVLDDFVRETAPDEGGATNKPAK